MTPAERTAPKDARSAYLASAAKIEAVLAGSAGQSRLAATSCSEDRVPAKVITREPRRAPETVRIWCRVHIVGSKMGDAWLVGRVRLNAWMCRSAAPD
ncbi:hypothetical protein [Methylobacterium durans]|uniref:Uncharacterized protein n=1 Tax=Methylobacterium durans TaxID=2202825 RepID=A0A2U8W2W8_9HYPH|nr:hypothetical protein [Methylobacterium durans]AWN39971.1 hypothetical protein DK389_04705 [Methylobacterium durans]